MTRQVEPELLRTLPEPSSKTVETLDWISYLELFSDNNGSLAPPVDQHDDFFAKSITGSTDGKRDLPCSAVGSKDALGSSNKRRPTVASSESTELINIRDLNEHSTQAL